MEECIVENLSGITSQDICNEVVERIVLMVQDY